MTEQPFDSADQQPVAPDATAVVLEQILAQGRVIAEAEVEKVRRVIDWVVVNEVDPATHDVGPLCDRALRTAGEGSPYVSEFSIMEFSAVLGMSTDGGRAYLCGVAELRYRLPHLWEQVEAGVLPVWRALEIAKDTWTLPEAGAMFVDRHLADAAVSCSWAQIARLVEEATARFDPERAEEQRRRRADYRRFDIDLKGVGVDGIVHVDATLDLADALDLEAAIASVATQLADLGCEEPWEVRRSLAAGEIARAQGSLGLDLGEPEPGFRGPPSSGTSTTGEDPAEVEVRAQRASKPQPPTTGRSVVLHLHLTEAALRGEDVVGRCGNTRTPVTVEQIREWCGNPDTHVTVRPILDLDAHHHTEAYEIPDRLRVQAELTTGTCVFPYCTREAVACDVDHAIPWDRGGPTCSCNIAPLCRRHHRAKTHSKWSYVILGPGIYLWTTPTGHDLIRDSRGTRRPPPMPPLNLEFGPPDVWLGPEPAEP